MRPLNGVRVLELAHLFPGPYLAAILAGLGADVVKVEPPSGDAARHLPPLLPETGHGFAFGASNAGKRSIVLDLKRAAHKAAFDELATKAHVVVQGYRPGVAERLGVDGVACLRRNPGLVYVHLTGWGVEGARRDLPGHDIEYQALAGCLLPGPEPLVPPTPTADVLGAMWGALLAIAALGDARQTGRGAVVPVSLAGASLAASTLTRALEHAGWDRTRQPHLLRGGLPGYNIYRCRDGRWIALGILEADRWEGLCKAVGDPGLFEHGLPATPGEAAAAHARLQATIARRDRAEWLRLLRDAGVSSAPVLSATEGADGGAAAGAIVPPHAGSREEAFEAPRLGAHTADVLAQWLGWGPDRVRSLDA